MRPDLEAEKIAGRSRDAAARALVSLYNRLPEFDPDAPENADLAEQMRAAGLPVVRKQANQQLRFVQDMRTGAWSVVSAPKAGGQATAAAVTTPDGKPLATTSSAQMSAEQQEANRRSREKVAQWQIAARKEIAAASRAVQEARVRMSGEQFRQRYPGAGQVLTKDALIQKWQQLQKADPDVGLERVMQDAVKQGYTIQ
jgi:hypothetical protein